MFTSDFAAAAVLITFGAVLGKLSPIQYVVMAFLEIIVFQVNEYIGLKKFKVNIRLKKLKLNVGLKKTQGKHQYADFTFNKKNHCTLTVESPTGSNLRSSLVHSQ